MRVPTPPVDEIDVEEIEIPTDVMTAYSLLVGYLEQDSHADSLVLSTNHYQLTFSRFKTPIN